MIWCNNVQTNRVVTKTSSKGLSEVLTERRSACGGCQTTQGCNTCLSTAKIKAKVHNPIGAQTGDLVEIQMDNQAIWQGAMILYGFPLMGLIVGAIVGASVDVQWFAGESTLSVLAGLAGLILGLALAGFSFSKSWYLSLALVVVIGIGQTGPMTLPMALIQNYTKDEYRGRVLSVYGMEMGMSSFGAFFAGLLAASIGVQWAVGGLALILVLLSLLALAFMPRLRKLD